MIKSPQIRVLPSGFGLPLPFVGIAKQKCVRTLFVSRLSRIPTAKNKFHHLRAEIGQDSDHPFREKMLWGPAIE
jgi:hypothetical protein